MRFVLVTPPVEEPITLAQAKLAAKIEDDDEDDLLTMWIAAARQELDGAQGYLGRALCTQTWDIGFSQFERSLVLPLPPLQEVVSVKYLDTVGDVQTLSTDQYRVIDGGFMPSEIVLVPGATWPSTVDAVDAVTVRITCGYGDAGDVPDMIKSWMQARIAGWFEQRSDLSIGMPLSMAPNIKNMLSTFRVYPSS